MSVSTQTFSIDQLRDAVRGRVIAPDDADYDTAREIMYAGPETRPAAIVRVADAADVSTVVSIARETGIDWRCAAAATARPATVRPTAASSSTCATWTASTSTSRPDGVGRQRADRWRVLTAAAEHGLATGFGDTGLGRHRRDHARAAASAIWCASTG